MPSLHQLDCDKAWVLFYYQAHFRDPITKVNKDASQSWREGKEGPGNKRLS